MQTLADLAGTNNSSGEDYANELINSSARIMLADVQSAAVTGFSLVDALPQVCGACEFKPIYQAGGGVRVRSVISSPFAEIVISKVEVLADSTGAQIMVIDDGITQKEFPFIALGGTTFAPLIINYRTAQKTVKIYLRDTSVMLGMVYCETKGGCGCGGARAAQPDIIYSGISFGLDNATQYGFRVCATVSCNYDIATCQLINSAPRLFGLTLLYKIGAKFYGEAPLSLRNNRTASFNDVIQENWQQYFDRLYRERLAGSAKVDGIAQILSAFLSNHKKDRCIKCNNPLSTGYAIG